jgi:hypothetical protein
LHLKETYGRRSGQWRVRHTRVPFHALNLPCVWNARGCAPDRGSGSLSRTLPAWRQGLHAKAFFAFHAHSERPRRRQPSRELYPHGIVRSRQEAIGETRPT